MCHGLALLLRCELTTHYQSDIKKLYNQAQPVMRNSILALAIKLEGPQAKRIADISDVDSRITFSELEVSR